jgi:hypothetical protein
MTPFLILKAIPARTHPAANEAPGHTDLMVTPEEIDAFLDANPPPPEVVAEDTLSQIPTSDDAEKRDIKLGLGDRLEEARRFADMGKSLRLIDPERPHEAHLVGPDLADPGVWRHTLLVDDEPFTDQEFDRAEDAFLSALQSGVVPVGEPDQGHPEFDLDTPLGFDE